MLLGGCERLQHLVDHGGQGLLKTIGAAGSEMLNSANMIWAPCPVLSDGAVELRPCSRGSELKALYLETLPGGKWTGTRNLTEPQAGSDLALVRSRA